MLLLHQDGHGQKPVVVLMMVYFPDGKTSLVAPLQEELSHSLLFWLAQVSALCFPEHLLVWGILF